MSEEQKIATIRRLSDAQGKTAKRVLGDWERSEEILKDAPRARTPPERKLPKVRPDLYGRGYRQRKVALANEVNQRIEYVRRCWNISSASFWRFCVQELLERYGFLDDDLQVLRHPERKALRRDPKYRRPLTPRKWGDLTWREKAKRARNGPFDLAGDDTKRPLGVFPGGVSIPEDYVFPGDDPDSG
jgi:hypothetical protein